MRRLEGKKPWLCFTKPYHKTTTIESSENLGYKIQGYILSKKRPPLFQKSVFS